MRIAACVPILLALAVAPASATVLDLSLASTRSRFTVAEPIELALLCSGARGRSETLTIRHSDGSALLIDVPVDAGGVEARLVTIPPYALKPGGYLAAAGTRSVSFSVYPDLVLGQYWTGQWVYDDQESRGAALAKGRWMGFTSDLTTLHPRVPMPDDLAESYLAARMKPLERTALGDDMQAQLDKANKWGGGHQLDMDLKNDWGDPWVQRSIAWRMQLSALSNRIYPMAGIHAFDGPALTHWPYEALPGHPADLSPYAVPVELDDFAALTGVHLPEGQFNLVGTQYAKLRDPFLQFMEMRLQYMEQTWTAAVWGTDSVNPSFTTINLQMSGTMPSHTIDGLDSRENRPFSIIMTADWARQASSASIYTVRSAESSYGFSWDKPHYMLPVWGTPNWAEMRQGVWLPWTTGVEGIVYPPEMDFDLDGMRYGYNGAHTVFEIAELNRRLARIGGVMAQLPKTPSPVAVLHSSREVAWEVTQLSRDTIVPGHSIYVDIHPLLVQRCFYRAVDAGIVPNWVDEYEATQKGPEFLKQWKVIYCPGLMTATPEFRKLLTDYVAAGGKLIQYKTDAVKIPGAIVADYPYATGHDYVGEHEGQFADKLKRMLGPDAPPDGDVAYADWSDAWAEKFASDLHGWIGERPYRVESNSVLTGIHTAGPADYLLMANDSMKGDPPHRQHPRPVSDLLLPVHTHVRVPPGGVVYDLLNGGRVPVTDGRAPLSLAAGDGACWLRLPRPPGPMKLSASASLLKGSPAIHIGLAWGDAGCLPFRLRIFDPAANKVDELFRATTPGGDTTTFAIDYPIGANAARGHWSVEVSEWLDNSKVTVSVPVNAAPARPSALLNTGRVSVYFDDERRIGDLFAGKSPEPPYGKLNRDARRVFGLDPHRFAIYGPDTAARKIADALRARGMTVTVNAPYEIVPFQREPRRGGAGPGPTTNFENIYAHVVVLPGHPLGHVAWDRGLINRPVTGLFPGPGRAYVQWGASGYQAGWEDVWAFGDTDAAVEWLLSAIQGKPADRTAILKTAVRQSAPPVGRGVSLLKVARETRFYDTPVGVASGPGGETFVLLYDGSVTALDRAGRALWQVQPLEEGAAIALSPRGDRLAAGGYPGMVVLDTRTGQILGSFSPKAQGHVDAPMGSFGWNGWPNRILSVAWNTSGTLVAAGFENHIGKAPLDPVVLDADGKLRTTIKGIVGDVMGVTFIPDSDTLLVGADRLSAVSASDGQVLWMIPIKGAQAFAFSPDGKTGAGGGWGREAASFDLKTGQVSRKAIFGGIIGGLAFLPGGDLAVAAWGGVKPLVRLGSSGQITPFFQSSCAFQTISWSPDRKSLLAAEQGGRIWLLSPAGKIESVLDDAGATVCSLAPAGSDVVVGRMDRVAQRIAIGSPRPDVKLAEGPLRSP